MAFPLLLDLAANNPDVKDEPGNPKPVSVLGAWPSPLLGIESIERLLQPKIVVEPVATGTRVCIHSSRRFLAGTAPEQAD